MNQGMTQPIATPAATRRAIAIKKAKPIARQERRVIRRSYRLSLYIIPRL